MFRNPNGGVENVQEMADAGMVWVGLNVSDYSPESWNVVRANAQAAGVVTFPKGRVAHPGFDTRETALNRLDFICKTAVNWGVPAAIINVETEIKKPEDGGLVVAEDVADALKRHGLNEAAVSTESFLYDINWLPLVDWPVLLQIYPEDNRVDPANLPYEMAIRVRRARAYGFRHVGVTYQAWRSDPDWYDRSGHAWNLAFGDDVGAGNWYRWS